MLLRRDNLLQVRPSPVDGWKGIGKLLFNLHDPVLDLVLEVMDVVIGELLFKLHEPVLDSMLEVVDLAVSVARPGLERPYAQIKSRSRVIPFQCL